MNSKPFNPFIAAIWRRLAETLLAEPDAMQISAQQVVDNLEAMFANIAGPKPRETALAVLAAGSCSAGRCGISPRATCASAGSSGD